MGKLTTNGNVRDIAENQADNGHFQPVHEPSAIFFGKFTGMWRSELLCWLLGSHYIHSDWSFGDIDSSKRYIAESVFEGRLSILGFFKIDKGFTAIQYGPYFMVYKFHDGTVVTNGLMPILNNKVDIHMLTSSGSSISSSIFSRILTIVSVEQVRKF